MPRFISLSLRRIGPPRKEIAPEGGKPRHFRPRQRRQEVGREPALRCKWPGQAPPGERITTQCEYRREASLQYHGRSVQHLPDRGQRTRGPSRPRRSPPYRRPRADRRRRRGGTRRGPRIAGAGAEPPSRRVEGVDDPRRPRGAIRRAAVAGQRRLPGAPHPLEAGGDVPGAPARNVGVVAGRSVAAVHGQRLVRPPLVEPRDPPVRSAPGSCSTRTVPATHDGQARRTCPSSIRATGVGSKPRAEDRLVLASAW